MNYIFAVLIFLISVQFGYGKKKYEVILEKFEPFTSTEKEYIDPQTLRITRKSRNVFVLSGNFTLFKNIGDDMVTTYEILQKEANGNYKPILKGKNTICKSMTANEKFYNKLRDVSNLPPADTCPFPKNAYYINDFQVDDDDYPIIAPKGEMICKVVLTKGDQEIFGYKVYLTIQ